MSRTEAFQDIPNTVAWRLHFQSPVARVFEFLTESSRRARYWAESAEEENGVIHFVFLNNIECRGKILESIPNQRFSVEYFDWIATFDLEESGDAGTDLMVTCRGVKDEEKREACAGWVSWLMAMKAAVDFGVDLRNHDPARTWENGFADN